MTGPRSTPIPTLTLARLAVPDAATPPTNDPRPRVPWGKVLVWALLALAAWDHAGSPIAGAVADRYVVEWHWPVIIRRRPHPTPSPVPAPIPPVPPAPVPAPTPVITGTLHISYIAERSEPARQSRFKRNPTIEKGLGQGDVFRWYSLGEAEPERLNILPADPSTLPCAIFQRDDGRILEDATLHDPTPEAIVAKARELRGTR
jgi:hypothetical protein